MSWHLITVLSIATFFAVAIEIAERMRLRRLLDRPCAETHWHHQFPSVPHHEIRVFLKLFAESFVIDAAHCTKFGPDDRPMAIYQARYVPYLTLDDHMEFERLSKSLESKYAIDLKAVWHENMTLGELFVSVRCGQGEERSRGRSGA